MTIHPRKKSPYRAASCLALIHRLSLQPRRESESGGVGAMEMVSRDMKALGMYLSGSISFGLCPESGKSVEYRERIHQLTPQQREMYNRAAAAWQAVLRNIDEALQITNGGRRARAA